MDSDMLERLMLDRALGALPPDCADLLAAYLQARPEAAAAGRELEQAVGLARRALAAEPDAPLPTFPFERLRRARQSYWTWTTARRIAGVAAAVLIGFMAHAMLVPKTTPGVPPPGQYVLVQAGPEPRAGVPAEDGGFWSARRLYERAAGARHEPAPRLIWGSPVTLPHIGDAT